MSRLIETPASDPLVALGIRRYILGAADVDEATETLCRVFTEGEPLTRTLSLTPADFRPFARAVCEAGADQGLSVIARDAGGRMVGFRIAEPWPAPAGEAVELPVGFAPIIALLTHLEDEFDRLHAADRRALHLQVMGCSPQYEGRGLAKAMVQDTLELAARRGIPRAFAEATHAGSARVFERLGFSTLAELPYATFEYEGRRVFADTPARGCRLVVKELRP